MLIRAFLLVLLLSSHAAYASLFGDNEAREQINALRKQVSEMEARIAKMEQALNSQALLELYAQVETLNQELGKLNGQVEMLSNDNALLQKRQRDFYIDLDNRLRQIEQPSGKPRSSLPDQPGMHNESHAAVAPSIQEPVAAPAASAATAEPAHEEIESSAAAGSASVPAKALMPAGPAENGAYQAAYDRFKGGDYVDAIAQFENFLQSYPQSNLAPAAAYWIGNAHYALRDYQLAIAAQQKLIAQYPDSNKVPDALLNIATSQNQMGDSKASRQTLENILAKYPNSEAGKKAKQRLANLK
ncbi:tol-pal system protein YbgF [Nitrosomonas sp. sh817]|uniref:tol-pal system protein YbgF n=1 Tax=Nitrosomonas sp. sh817 TaxID=3070658 RepID=UPI0027DE7649|nr:tol-pal system protein YbgF [Nitrosomonas sp. sh817]WMJ08746.1 tol-pal system protein YbgF [Nitrosomonas sp. sh817]